MKNIVILVLLLLTVQAIGQTPSNTVKVIGINKKLNIEVIKVCDTLWAGMNSYYLIIKKTKDSILISRQYYDIIASDTCIISAKQLDGKGSREIIMGHTKYLDGFMFKNFTVRSIKKRDSYIPPGYRNHTTTTTIMNIDTKKILFSGQNQCVKSVLVIQMSRLLQPQDFEWYVYRYEILFENKGKLNIKYLTPITPSSNNSTIPSMFIPSCTPDMKEGTYKLLNDQNIWIE